VTTERTATTPRDAPGSPGARRGFRPLRDVPAILWLLGTIAAAVFHSALPAPRWLMIHLLLLGAVSHSILVWTRHFSDALLHTPSGIAARRGQSARLALLNGGVLVVVIGVVSDVWLVTAVGASSVAAAALWHVVALVRQLRSALPARFAVTVRYYVAAAALLPLGALLGTLLARGVDDRTHERMLVAHVALNVLGWLGLTVLGTLVTLWPTMLRTRIAPGSEQAAARALPVLLTALALVVGASLTGILTVAALGVALYLAGVAVLGVPFVQVVRTKPASGFATQSVLAGLLWFTAILGALTISLASADSWAQAHDRLLGVTPALAVGFAAQVLVGAMSYLMPVVLRAGPSAVRAASSELDRGGLLRLALVNGGLVLSLLSAPGIVREAGQVMVLSGLVAFLPLMVLAARASRRAKTATAPPEVRLRPAGSGAGLAVAGLGVVLLAVALGVALDQAAPARAGLPPAAAGVVATGHTTQVEVAAGRMRFTPSRIEVPAGDRLVVLLRNTDADTVHDLVLDSGADSGRLPPGARVRLDVGVVGRDLHGWCSVAGHRQMGMVLDVQVTGIPQSGAREMGAPLTGTPSTTARSTATPPRIDFLRAPAAPFTAHPAELPPALPGRTHRLTLTVDEVVKEVAPGVTQRLWAYDGSVPGPVLHGAVGDVFDITLVNHASMGHSVDFHAGSLAPDRPMRTIPPGGTLRYTFTATKAGIWMYHCSTMPMSAHIANGLFGAVVIDPPGLRPAAKEYVLLQSELYLGPQGGTVDVDKLDAEQPDAVVFNGYANQYDHDPLTARVGDRVRIWLLDAGPNRGTSFHVVGGQFDTVYSEGAFLPLPRNGASQALALAPGQGGFVELTLPEPGHYPFVSHVMVDAERGAHGIIEVTRRQIGTSRKAP
jgi:nitrite reductase (NO-forming)